MRTIAYVILSPAFCAAMTAIMALTSYKLTRSGPAGEVPRPNFPRVLAVAVALTAILTAAIALLSAVHDVPSITLVSLGVPIMVMSALAIVLIPARRVPRPRFNAWKFVALAMLPMALVSAWTAAVNGEHHPLALLAFALAAAVLVAAITSRLLLLRRSLHDLPAW